MGRYREGVKWFTKDWYAGDLSEAQVAFARDDYAEHVAALVARRPDLASLRDLNLHDGQTQCWSGTAGVHTWRLVVGDLQVGYEVATIQYNNAEIIGGDFELGALLEDFDTEVLYDELDETSGRAVHRVRLWPGGEFWVFFDSASVYRSPGSTYDRRTGPKNTGGYASRLLRAAGRIRR